MTCHIMLERFYVISLKPIASLNRLSTDFFSKCHILAFVKFENDSEIYNSFLLHKTVP